MITELNARETVICAMSASPYRFCPTGNGYFEDHIHKCEFYGADDAGLHAFLKMLGFTDDFDETDYSLFKDGGVKHVFQHLATAIVVYVVPDYPDRLHIMKTFKEEFQFLPKRKRLGLLEKLL